MNVGAWDDFIADCGMATKFFDEERLRQAYAARTEKSSGQPINVIQFIGLLIKIAFMRLHPDHNEGELDTPGMTPVPQCSECHGVCTPSENILF